MARIIFNNIIGYRVENIVAHSSSLEAGQSIVLPDPVFNPLGWE